MTFQLILNMLEVAFNYPISERDYHDIVYCIGQYAKTREESSIEQDLLKARGWPTSYDICQVCERIRFAICFNREDNVQIRNLVTEFVSA